VDLVVYEEEIESIQKEIEEHRQRIDEINANTSDLKERFDAARKAQQAYENEKRDIAAQIDEVQRAYKHFSEEKNSKEEAVKHYEKMLQDLVKNKEEEIDKQLVEKHQSVAVSVHVYFKLKANIST
jgi:chromosome segregation ATPase